MGNTCYNDDTHSESKRQSKQTEPQMGVQVNHTAISRTAKLSRDMEMPSQAQVSTLTGMVHGITATKAHLQATMSRLVDFR